MFSIFHILIPVHFEINQFSPVGKLPILFFIALELKIRLKTNLTIRQAHSFIMFFFHIFFFFERDVIQHTADQMRNGF